MRVAEVLHVSPVILVEAFEAIVEIDGCCEGAGECEGNVAQRSDVAGRRGAGIVILDIYFLRIGRGKDES